MDYENILHSSDFLANSDCSLTITSMVWLLQFSISAIVGIVLINVSAFDIDF